MQIPDYLYMAEKERTKHFEQSVQDAITIEAENNISLTKFSNNK